VSLDCLHVIPYQWVSGGRGEGTNGIDFGTGFGGEGAEEGEGAGRGEESGGSERAGEERESDGLHRVVGGCSEWEEGERRMSESEAVSSLS
jgi:hypothetical protein